MKIIVCVKQVLDTAAKIAIKNRQVDTKGIPLIMNPYDEFAIEEAIRIKEKQEGVEVTLITLGPEKFKDVLRTGLAMGVDEAVHILDPAFEGLDHLGIAQVLAFAIRSKHFDLILCGRQAVDDDMAQVGPALGIFLDIPVITVVTKLEFSENRDRVTVTRQIEGGSEIFETRLPLLLTCQKGLNEPRLPSLKGIMKAKKKTIQIIDAAALGLDPTSLKGDHFKSLDLVLPPWRKKGMIIEGSPRESTAKVVKLLREEEKVV